MRAGLLCRVDISHDYWLNVDGLVHEALPAAQAKRLAGRHRVGRYLAVRPTPETMALMAGHKVVFKPTPAGFLLGVQLEADSTVPRLPLFAPTVLRFSMHLADPQFAAYTAALAPGFHRFTNASGNEAAGRLFLSQPVGPHEPTRAYSAGDLRSAPGDSGTLDLFQARRDTGPSSAPVAADWERIRADSFDPAASYRAGDVVLSGNRLFRALVEGPGDDLGDAAEWAAEGLLANQYATGADALALRSSLFLHPVTEAATVLDARVTREGTSVPAWQRRFEGEDALTQLQVDLGGLPDGDYRLDIHDSAGTLRPDLGLDFYLSPRGAAEGWFGVIEIGAGAGGFALLDGTSQLRSPTYQLRFVNLAARLRYRFAAAQPTGTGADVVADEGDNSILVTPSTRPLTLTGTGVRLRADDLATPAFSEEIRLPQPDPRGLTKENGQWFANLSLPSLPPLA